MLFRDTADQNPQQALAEFVRRLLRYLSGLRNLTLGCAIWILLSGVFAPHTPQEAFFVFVIQLLARGSTAPLLPLWIFVSLLYHRLTKPVSTHSPTRHRKSAPMTQPS